ncbi:hypothetical protein RUND412_008476 [Rhizina undulata]
MVASTSTRNQDRDDDGEGQSTFRENDEQQPLLEREYVGGDETQRLDERTAGSARGAHDEDEEMILTKRQLWDLYTSHFLSTWNARGYEFAAIVFTASAYPETLTASSIRGVLTTLSTLTLSSAVGRWADTHPSRLQALRSTIFFQRFCVCLACIGLTFIVTDSFVGGGILTQSFSFEDRLLTQPLHKGAVMAAIMLLGVGERLSAVGNMLVMERDWIPTLASPASTPSLHVLNASMRRIDLICKLIAPIFISLIAMLARSVRITVFVVLATNALSVGVEWIAAKRVWKECPKLREPRRAGPAPDEETIATATEEVLGEVSEPETVNKLGKLGQGLKLYFGSNVWIPSFALALLYFPPLSFSASMMTYLLNAHFTLPLITLARTLSTCIEVSSTVFMPWAVSLLSSSSPSGDTLVPLSRVGLWGLNFQLLNLIPVTISLFLLPSTSPTPASSHPFLTTSIFLFLAFSRLGLWTYDLVVQTLVQIEVAPANRGEFSGVEMQFVSAVELVQWVVTGIWSRPEEFRGVAAAGTGVVAAAAGAYSWWMWRQRGHLVHWEKVPCGRRR